METAGSLSLPELNVTFSAVTIIWRGGGGGLSAEVGVTASVALM